MDWTPFEIRQLRCRLGWSQAEMARYFKIELATVSGWETGAGLPEGTQCSTLLHIFNQAQNNAERMQRRPIAEVMMRDQGLSQIHDFEVMVAHTIPLKKNFDV